MNEFSDAELVAMLGTGEGEGEDDADDGVHDAAGADDANIGEMTEVPMWSGTLEEHYTRLRECTKYKLSTGRIDAQLREASWQRCLRSSSTLVFFFRQ